MTRSTLTVALSALLVLGSISAAQAASRTLTVRATHYCTACGGSRTATGRSARRAGLAVDPRVIPLGSRVYVPHYGVLIADDTGGAIKGRRIDIRLTSRGQCNRFGVKRLKVRVLSSPKRHR